MNYNVYLVITTQNISISLKYFLILVFIIIIGSQSPAFIRVSLFSI